MGGVDKLKCGHNELGNLSKLDGYAEDNVVQRENIHFTVESRGTLQAFSMFLFVKTISKLNMGHSLNINFCCFFLFMNY